MLQTVFSRATRNIVVGSCVAFLLTACLEDNEAGLTSTNNVVTDSRVSGSVGDGPIAGASMQVLRNDGQELTTFESDARANYNISVSTEDQYYPLKVTANGGIDLVTNLAPDFELLGAVYRPRNQNVANVNPFSTIAYLLAEEMPGGATEANLQAAETVVSTQLNSGLESLASSGPMTTHIDETNIAEIVKASEALAETIRRTRDLMTGAGFARNADQIVAAISSDLTDQVIDGRGGSSADARTAAIATLVYAQVLIETMANQLRVNGSDATGDMESAIDQVSIRAATVRLDGLNVTGSMVTKARIGLAAAFAFDSRTSISNLHTAVSGLQAGMNPSLVRTLLPSDYRIAMDSTLVALAGADATTIDMINGIARGNGDIAPGNRAPTIEGSPSTMVEEGGSYSFTPTATDPDGDNLTFTIQNMPSWASFRSSDGLLSGAPTMNEIGNYNNIVISVSDGEFTESLPAFSIEVFAGNAAPTVSGTPTTTIVAGQSYVFQPTASDPNTDNLTFSISNQPSWASFNPTNGRLSGAPFESDVGTYPNIVITVSDGSLSDSLPAFTVTVESAVVPNAPPQISGNPPAEVNAGDAYSFTPTASDADGDSLSFSISNRPSWASFDSSTGMLSGTPGDGDVGSYSNIRIGVSDGTDNASLEFSITVVASDNSTPIDVTFTVSATSGVIPLEVNFSASQYSEINEYRWDFGDGSAAVGPVQAHTFSEAGAYTVTLTATLDDGTQYSAQRNIDAFSSINNTDVIVPGTALFFDSFEYTADRDDAGVVSIFQDHGWTTVKSQQSDPGGNPLGYIYTTDTVPGYEGGMLPGAGSDRVLVMEALPTTLGFYEGPNTFWGNMQTDFYLQIGAANAPAGTIPADVWFQFWLYTTGGTTGGYDRKMKFLYPCNGNYGCDSESWKVLFGSSSYHPNWVELSSSGEPVADAFVHVSGNTAVWTPGQFAESRLGHTDASELIMGGRWVLVKLHIDTSGPQGVFEAWLKPLGGTEVKVAEHVGGVTPGFQWPVSDHSGHRVLRMPTTIGSQNVVDLYPQSYDVTFYMDDFTMATSEDDLPRYPY